MEVIYGTQAMMLTIWKKSIYNLLNLHLELESKHLHLQYMGTRDDFHWSSDNT